MLNFDKRFWTDVFLVLAFWGLYLSYRAQHPVIPWLDRDYGTAWSYEGEAPPPDY